MEHPQYPGLQISENMREQKREWRVQRIAWAILYPLLFAIIIGLFGKGPISSAQLETASGAVHLKYERFLRYNAPDTLELTVQATSETVRVMLDNQYARKIQIEKITPTPTRVISGADTMIFVFSSRASTPMRAEFYFQPEKIGFLDGWIAV
jgi:hypothetical protein